MKALARKNVESKYKWDLSDIVADDTVWEDAYNKLQLNKQEIFTYKGRLSDDAVLLECFRKDNAQSKICENLIVYAKMRQDEDTRSSASQGMVGRIRSLITEIGAINSFIVPEITSSHTKEQLIALSEKAEFADYSYYLKELARNMERVLSDKEERIIALTGNMAHSFQNIFTMFDNADIKFGDVKDEKGRTIQLTHGVYSELMQSPNREVRRTAYDSMFTAYKDMVNVITGIYSGNVQKDYFYSQVRGYGSCLENAMDGENVPQVIYDNLIESVEKGIVTLHKYVGYRKKQLKLSKMAMYDMHVPLTKGADMKLNYEDAYSLVCEALAPLGEDYVSLLKDAYNNHWIDVMETAGKRSGAYSWGTYSSHPYVLLNYKRTTHDIFTIAHEMGHSIHSYMSNNNQPYPKAGYEIFVAEVASTVNEMLLLRYLLKKATPKQSRYLLTYLMDMFRTTLFRQTMFAEFEKQAHELIEKGGTLSPDKLCSMYSALNTKYYGASVTDKLISYEWARIPHFYSSFYVYKYATGIISAAAISADIFEGKQGAVERYKQFLSAGGSMPPSEILKIAGVDLTQKDPFEKAMRLFADTYKRLERV